MQKRIKKLSTIIDNLNLIIDSLIMMQKSTEIGSKERKKIDHGLIKMMEGKHFLEDI